MRSWLAPALVLACATSGAPCTVESVLTDAEAFRQSDAVFVGRVTDIRDQLEGSPDGQTYVRRVTLRVKDVWKGTRDEHSVVWTLPGEGLCGVPFAVGQVFLVFAGGKPLATWIAFPSRALNGVEAVPKQFGHPKWHSPGWPTTR